MASSAKTKNENISSEQERKKPENPSDDFSINLKDLPKNSVIVLPVRRMVMFPDVTIPVVVGRPGSIAAARAAKQAGLPVAIVMQQDYEVDAPSPKDMCNIGTLSDIQHYTVASDGTRQIMCLGRTRIRLKTYLKGYPFLIAKYDLIKEPEDRSAAIDARFNRLKQISLDILQYIADPPESLVSIIMNMEHAGQLADLAAHLSDLEASEKQQILEAIGIKKRLDLILRFLDYRLKVLKLEVDIGQQTKETLSKQQREHVLRQQLRHIQKELGDANGHTEEIATLRETLENANMPEEAYKKAMRDMSRLERISDTSAEYSMLRTYLETVSELPWAPPEIKTIDIDEAKKILDADHFGLRKVKKRILEFLAVRKLNPDGKSPILCLVGPPGVGKTSLGQSIARAMGRKFARLSLGGVHDETEIRGHRMTYIGALPGNIIETLRRSGTRDCVLMLDEMDKLGSSVKGDPSSALLEVLDPEQNTTFRDNYLSVPFDLSQVVFIATANVLSAIPRPLRDRMEVLQLPGYTDDEKLQIAKRYLVSRRRKENGLQAKQCKITDAALRTIIRDYTREAGVRELERVIGAAFRSIAVKVAGGLTNPVTIKPADLHDILGPARYEDEIAMRTSVSGVATGLAWTPVGGDILFIEAALSKGSGKLILTGQLGDVMKESAQAALTLLKSRANTLNLDPDLFDKNDVHIHVPAGAIPKDGPSAGVAIFSALASLFLEQCVRNDTAMTGEISLRGMVLPVGGIKEKVTAAARAGIKTVLLPARNKRDFEDIPESARKQVKIKWIETVDDALKTVLNCT